MSIAREIAPHLPYLRRFARALSGSQPSGDAHVVATLEALVEDPTLLSRTIPAKEALYQAFLNLWTSTNNHRRGLPRAFSETAADRNIDALTPLPRQAFLLRTVEGFSSEETARVLGKTVPETMLLLDAAGREIAEQVATSILIIEDEPLIALDIETLVRELGHEVTGIARTRDEAVKLVEQREPGLVLADIQLADGSSGLDAVNQILHTIEVPIIFITAFPERLLTGEKPEPAFLITKPFQADSVKAAISQALFFDRRASRKTEPKVA